MNYWALVESSSDNFFILTFYSVGVWKELKGWSQLLGTLFEFRSIQFFVCTRQPLKSLCLTVQSYKAIQRNKIEMVCYV